MKTPDDGGPAFANEERFRDGHLGMSLRDYFAARALQAMISKAPFETRDGTAGDRARQKAKMAALSKSAFGYADAMLAERTRQREEAK